MEKVISMLERECCCAVTLLFKWGKKYISVWAKDAEGCTSYVNG
jgi:hypothetical protein